MGKYCEHSYCLDNCGGPDKGICDFKTLLCKCKPGYFGKNCMSECNHDCNNFGDCL